MSDAAAIEATIRNFLVRSKKADIDFGRHTSLYEEGLGLELVRALTRQLRGDMTFQSRGGQRCELRFTVPTRTQERSA